MHYSRNMVRPPDEANNVLLQVTVGCSYNKCSFFNSYPDDKFRVSPLKHIEEIKYLTFAKAKKGLSKEEFEDYYNNKHIPLCIELVPILKKCTIRRNYLQADQVIFPPNFSGELEYDVVTESIWPDQETFNEFIASTASAEVQAKIAADEVNVFEGGTKVVMVKVDENNPED